MGSEERNPHRSPAWSATSQKCPPMTSCPSILSMTCVEPEVSIFQMRLPSAFENAAT